MLILIVDDDEAIARVVGSYLNQAGYDIISAYNMQSAIDMLQKQNIDLLILDIMLPDGDGWKVIDFTRQTPKLRDLPIVVLSAKIEDTDKIYGLQLGADDYITKPFNPQLIVAKVQRILKRIYPNPTQSILRFNDLQMDTNIHEVQVAGEVINLTPTEFAILKTMMENPGYVFSRAELISRSLGHQYESLERTIDSHMRNLRGKIEIDTNNPQYIQTVYGVGYALRENST